MFFIRYPVPEIRDEVPEDFSKPPNFLTADGSARIGTGGSAAAWGASDVQQMRALPSGPQRLFRNLWPNDSHLIPAAQWIARGRLSFAGCCCDRV